jgi:hypothetical protein
MKDIEFTGGRDPMRPDIAAALRSLTQLLWFLLLFVLISTWVESSQARPQQLPSACQALIAKTLPAWKPAAPDADVVAWAKSRNFNPIIAVGDFDGNGQKDWATIGVDGSKNKVILCLSQESKISLRVAEDSVCTNLVQTLSAKTKVFNYDTGMREVLKHDSVSTSCFERASRVFPLENRKLRVFSNSD